MEKDLKDQEAPKKESKWRTLSVIISKEQYKQFADLAAKRSEGKEDRVTFNALLREALKQTYNI